MLHAVDCHAQHFADFAAVWHHTISPSSIERRSGVLAVRICMLIDAGTVPRIASHFTVAVRFVIGCASNVGDAVMSSNATMIGDNLTIIELSR